MVVVLIVLIVEGEELLPLALPSRELLLGFGSAFGCIALVPLLVAHCFC